MCHDGCDHRGTDKNVISVFDLGGMMGNGMYEMCDCGSEGGAVEGLA